MQLATPQQCDAKASRALAVNRVLKEIFAAAGLDLVDFKLEFGVAGDELLLIDEISPDTCSPLAGRAPPRAWTRTASATTAATYAGGVPGSPEKTGGSAMPELKIWQKYGLADTEYQAAVDQLGREPNEL